ncbi:MAG TPA: SRPBCC family protein [Nocardioidaceae bacterium]|nr:SRPBCC family protein [Nocardioidaceae bacterium]
MTRFEHSVVIDRPLEEVWGYVNDPGNNPVWQGPMIEVRGSAGAPLELGSEIAEVAQFLGKRFEITLEVTEHEPMRHSAVRTSAGPVRLDGSYRFEPVDGGTRFTTEGEVEAHGFFRLAEPVFARLAAREWASSCENLKDPLEAGGTNGSP